MSSESDMNHVMTPPLKWAGGKRWLVSRVTRDVPRPFARYFEPFVGGAAMFFKILPTAGCLSDVNQELIEFYRILRDQPTELSTLLSYHHNRHNADYYYQLRSTIPSTPIERAARFLYLNRTCWNGLYRVNKKGEFNVPIGTKTAVFDSSERFDLLAEVLKRVEIQCCDFEKTLDQCAHGDFAFVDPPYTVRHNNNGFLKYNESIFSWDDQVRLRDCIERAANRGASILVTNAAHDSVRELYHEIGDISTVDRPSILAGKSTSRSMTQEIVIRIGGGLLQS